MALCPIDGTHSQGTSVVVCPGKTIEITPAHAHTHLEVSFSAGIFATHSVGEPGVQGAKIFGVHGIGVNTPRAADVAEATEGFATELHIPKGMMFTIGM
jgi:hypothetical protein